jgi:hypothetical protein
MCPFLHSKSIGHDKSVFRSILHFYFCARWISFGEISGSQGGEYEDNTSGVLRRVIW